MIRPLLGERERYHTQSLDPVLLGVKSVYQILAVCDELLLKTFMGCGRAIRLQEEI